MKDLVNNIKNNTISEMYAKKGLNALNKIKNAEIEKYKKRTPGQNKLLNLFNDWLDIILTDKTLKPKSQRDDDNENDKTLMSSKNENGNNIIKQLSDTVDEIIDKSVSFEEQIKLMKKVENLNEYWFSDDYGDKELKFKYFKPKLAYLSNVIDKKIFKHIWSYTWNISK